MASFLPLIAVVGTTGVSKSRLAVDLAAHCVSSSSPLASACGAKIINGDAMQVYKGLNVITNKIAPEEQRGIEHLLMDFRSPGEQYLVTDWLKDTVSAINNMHQHKELPIVVGGTAYWIQHLIFASRLASVSTGPLNAERKLSVTLQESVNALPFELRSLWNALPEKAPPSDQKPGDAFALHSLLSSVDPETAARWHWRDSRRVLTSLRVIHSQGMKASEFMVKQAQGVYTRYNTLIFWLYTDPKVLHPRLDARVDRMLEAGLLEEIKELRNLAKSRKDTLHPSSTNEVGLNSGDYTTGIFQSIGYKEFDRYLSLQSDGKDSLPIFTKAVEDMKCATRQYARRQLQWLRNKLQPLIHTSSDVRLCVLDVTDPNRWQEDVQGPACKALQDFLAGRAVPRIHALSESALQALGNNPEKHAVDPTDILAVRRKIICQICTRDDRQPVMIEEGAEWQLHIRTRSHKKGMSRRARDQLPSPDSSEKVGN